MRGLIAVLRLLLGGVFIFSGVVKCIDPVGTAVFVEKYLATYSLDSLLPAALVIAVILGSVELWIGAMLALRKCYGLALRFATLFLVIFTIITLLSATVLPIGDCGCFGDALKLSPWATFLKNIVLLVVVAVIWRYDVNKGCDVTLRNVVVGAAVMALAIGVNGYALRYLPPVDFMPYRVGTDIVAAIDERDNVEYVMVCRNTATGEVREFSADDDEWYEGWEVVGSHPESDAEDNFADFVIYDNYGVDVTESVVQRGDSVVWLCVRSVDMLREYVEYVEKLLMQYDKSSVLVLTSEDAEVIGEIVDAECFAMDALVLRSVMRSEVGVVLLEDGVIVDKRDIRDI